MIHDQFEDFAAALQPMQALMGLDLGEKTIGVARVRSDARHSQSD